VSVTVNLSVDRYQTKNRILSLFILNPDVLFFLS